MPASIPPLSLSLSPSVSIFQALRIYPHLVLCAWTQSIAVELEKLDLQIIYI